MLIAYTHMHLFSGDNLFLRYLNCISLSISVVCKVISKVRLMLNYR